MNLESKVHALGTEPARLFVAIPLPDEVRTTLQGVQDELKELLPHHSAAWTRPDAMHLTLRFLGNVNSADIPELSQRLSVELAGFGGLDLVCERLGCFPDLRFPRVVWAWVHDEAERLTSLHSRVEETVADFAEKPAEAGFVGHITLARPKQIKRPDAERLARFVEGDVHRKFGSWRANSVCLIRSRLSPDGARYEEVSRAHLGCEWQVRHNHVGLPAKSNLPGGVATDHCFALTKQLAMP